MPQGVVSADDDDDDEPDVLLFAALVLVVVGWIVFVVLQFSSNSTFVHREGIREFSQEPSWFDHPPHNKRNLTA